MAKIIYDITVRLMITYAMLVGTGIIISGMIYMFINKNPLESSAVIGIGAAMIVGKSAIEKFAPNGNGNGNGCKNGSQE